MNCHWGFGHQSNASGAEIPVQHGLEQNFPRDVFGPGRPRHFQYGGGGSCHQTGTPRTTGNKYHPYPTYPQSFAHSSYAFTNTVRHGDSIDTKRGLSPSSNESSYMFANSMTQESDHMEASNTMSPEHQSWLARHFVDLPGGDYSTPESSSNTTVESSCESEHQTPVSQNPQHDPWHGPPPPFESHIALDPSQEHGSTASNSQHESQGDLRVAMTNADIDALFASHPLPREELTCQELSTTTEWSAGHIDDGMTGATRNVESVQQSQWSQHPSELSASAFFEQTSQYYNHEKVFAYHQMGEQSSQNSNWPAGTMGGYSPPSSLPPQAMQCSSFNFHTQPQSWSSSLPTTGNWALSHAQIMAASPPLLQAPQQYHGNDFSFLPPQPHQPMPLGLQPPTDGRNYPLRPLPLPAGYLTHQLQPMLPPQHVNPQGSFSTEAIADTQGMLDGDAQDWSGSTHSPAETQTVSQQESPSSYHYRSEASPDSFATPESTNSGTSELLANYIMPNFLPPDASEHEQKLFLLAAHRRKMPYRDIKIRGNFSVKESTLRGRVRTIEKSRAERPRKPKWTDNDIKLLNQGVDDLRVYEPGRKGTDSPFKIPWKKVGEYMQENGASFRFSPNTIAAKYRALKAEENDNNDVTDHDAEGEPEDVFGHAQGMVAQATGFSVPWF